LTRNVISGAEAAATDDAGVFSIAGVPFWVVYLAAFGIVLVRAQATYWAGRGVARGTGGTRMAARLGSPRAAAVVARVHRWGPAAVTLSFLTVGVQTLVNLAAGYLRMPFPRYLVALLLGCAAWAAIWTTVGTAAVNGAVALAARSPVSLAVLAVVAVGLAMWAVRRRRSRPRQP
jgi:membrane protein DedA with SNARE-associated domain